MTKILKALEAAGWVDTTLGECRPGEEVVIVDNGHVRHEFITRADVTRGTVSDAKGFHWAAETPAQRPPRPEYAPGTVALIRWSEDQPPVRAWKILEHWVLSDGVLLDDDAVEVVRVLLPADQDTSPVEVTDEMVERAAKAQYRLDWGLYPDEGEWSSDRETYRASAQGILEAALGVEK